MGITHSYRPKAPALACKRVIAGLVCCLGLGGLLAQTAQTAQTDQTDQTAQVQDSSKSAWPMLQPAVTLQGFGTLGLARVDDNAAQLVRDLSQPNGAGKHWASKVDSLLGVQANLQFSPNTVGVVQLVSRYHADSSYRPELTWAFVRHDFSPDLALRVGRLGTEFYMLGDSRLVGYANLSLRPPPDFYGSLVFSYIDGLDATWTRPLASGLLKGKLFVGLSPEKTPYAPGILWDLDGTQLVGAYADYSRGPWQFRLSHAQVRFHHEMPVDKLVGMPYLAMVPAMSMAGQQASFSSLGLVYDRGPVNAQLMLNQIHHDSAAYASSRAAYAMAAYRLGAITPYVGVSRSVSDTASIPLTGNPVLDGIVTPSLVAQSLTDRHTYTVGARWDLHKNMALKAQVDWVRGTSASVFLLKNVQPGRWDGNLTAFSLALDFVF